MSPARIQRRPLLRPEVPLRPVLVLCCVVLGAACGTEGNGSPGGVPSSADERLAAWERDHPDAPVPVALGFGGPVPDSAVVSLLARHHLRPYALYLVAAGMASQQRVSMSEASLELVTRGREEALNQTRVSLCAQPDRARAMLEDLTSGADAGEPSGVAAVLTHVGRLQSELPALATGAPLVYGVEAVGSLPDVEAVRGEPLVRSFEPGTWADMRGERRIIVPQPATLEGAGGSEVAPEYAAMGPEELQEALRTLAEGIAGCDEVEPLAR